MDTLAIIEVIFLISIFLSSNSIFEFKLYGHACDSERLQFDQNPEKTFLFKNKRYFHHFRYNLSLEVPLQMFLCLNVSSR